MSTLFVHARPKWLPGLVALLAAMAWHCGRLSAQEQADVLVYGATPAGIAAAAAAAQDGQSVLLIEPTVRIGGLVTSGLSHTDFRTFEGLTGAFLKFSQRVEAHYARTYGLDSPQVRDSFRGTFGEPKVNLAVFESLLREQPNIILRTGLVLQSVKVDRSQHPPRIEEMTCVGSNRTVITLSAKLFIDASYEGDLMAMAGVAWRSGREGQQDFGESLAPDQADDQLQAYNFRFIMTREPANRVTPLAPPGYRREDFIAVLPILESGRIKMIFDYPRDCIFKAQTPPLPNGKYDINDVSGGLVRLSLPGKNLQWPDGTAAERSNIFAEHRRDQVGLLYFLQNDPAVPAMFRDEAREWGWCRDEFTDTGHLPPQLYVREARRMQGVHIFTQHDSEHAPGDVRSVRHRDAVAIGDYGNNCHGTLHDGPRFGGRHAGEFYNSVPPYQVSYGAIVPRDLGNLLVPAAVSSSHVGFCALRLEPIWMSLGQAAGHAGAQAVKQNLPVQAVDVPDLQRRLHADGSATIYVSDVLPGHPDFAAVQWWGTAGGLHGLQPMPAKKGQRGKNLHGQYYAAYPGHAADLDHPLDAPLAERWKTLAKRLKLAPESVAGSTRGDFIRAAWKQHQAAPATVGDAAVVTGLPGLVAFWMFGEDAGQPRLSTGTPDKHPLTEVGGPIPRVSGGPFSGYAADLNGKQYFRIPYAETGDLNLSGPNAQVSLFAVVRIVNLRQSRTIAGMWSEGKGANDDTGTRQYALLMNMPTYGGPNKLVPHISSEGGVTRRADGSAFPWCCDYAVTAHDVPTEKWCSLGFTYDGKFIRAYLNGVLDELKLDPVPHQRTDRYFTQEGLDGSDRGMNPYFHGRGIFRYEPDKHSTTKPGGGSDFTIGARYAVGKMLGEATIGRFGGLAVFRRSLSEAEMAQLHQAAAVERLNHKLAIPAAASGQSCD
ncbi:MAG: FAD-dependent oxidoreductase [Planctomycetaceae bacterium]|nr:FAD-dependent oxidoreductase [Planctomycetaceae bacterium]